MRRFTFIWYIIIIIILPISIVALSGNVMLRIPETYTYHFNDSLVMEDVGSSLSGTEFADAITDYFNSPGGDEFQVYEENGDFRDPIFDENESRAMGRAKAIMTWTLFGGIVFLGGGIATYIYMTTCVERTRLRLIGFITLIVSAAELLIVDLLIARESFRKVLYDRFIGIDLGKESTVKILLGSPFEKTYIIFSSVLCVAIIAIFLYIHHSVTREKRLFS